jgi:hypothetical protein
MSRSSSLSWPFLSSHAPRGQRRNPASRPKRAHLALESLEGRALLTTGGRGGRGQPRFLVFTEGASSREKNQKPGLTPTPP